MNEYNNLTGSNSKQNRQTIKEKTKKQIKNHTAALTDNTAAQAVCHKCLWKFTCTQ